MIKKILLFTASLILCSQVLAQSNGRYAIINQHSGMAIDVDSFSTADGANIIQWEYWGADNQHWDVTNQGNGVHSIINAFSGKSLDVFNWSMDPGGDIAQYAYWGGAPQQWIFTNMGGGFYQITSALNGLALEVWEWSTAGGAEIRQWTPTGAANQLWRLAAPSSGSSSSSSSTSSTSSGGGAFTGSSCSSTGSTSVSSTILVTSGSYDGGCRTFNPTSALGDGGQSESQDPAFRVENGATLRNVIIGNNGVDGIHMYNGATLDNIHWTNVGEDAATVKSSGTTVLRNIEAYNGEDKFLQVNAVTDMTVDNCIVDSMGKFLRQNGGTTFRMSINVSNCQISNMSEGIFRSDSPNATARITNSRLHNAGSICIGSWSSCTSSGITNY